MTQVASTTSYPKLNIHKFQDIKPKLGRDSWSSWNREILATVREGGIYAVINGTDITCNTPNSMTSLTQLMDEWHNRNNSAYNQMLLCISLELQTMINDMDITSEAWKILLGKFESHNPSKISITRTHYENYHMIEGQSVVTYLTIMRE